MAQFVNRLGDIVADSGRIPKGAFVRWAMQLLPVTVPSGNAEMFGWSGPVILCDCCEKLLCFTRRKLQMPGTAEEHTKDGEYLQSTQPTVNRHTSQTKHQALSRG